MSVSIWGTLGQVVPAATTLTDAYAAPTNRHATVEVFAANQGVSADIRIAIAPQGEADAAKHYLLYDYTLNTKDVYVSVRFVVGEGDVVRVYSTTATVSFNINGIEETQ